MKPAPGPTEIRRMSRLRAALEAEIARQDAAGERASYDYRGLARLLRPRLTADGRGWRRCAAEIGVTAPDLSRVCAGQGVSVEKVFAICDWLGIDPRRFYAPCSTGKPLKQKGAR